MKMYLKTKLMICGLLALCGVGIASPLEFYISPEGNDGGPGTFDQPFATLTAARDAIRRLPPPEREDDIVVYIRGGQYVLNQTFVLNRDDGGREGHRVTYAAYREEEPVFSSDIRMTGWKKLREYPANVPPAAHGKLYYVDLPEVKRGELFFKALYKDGKPLVRARSRTVSMSVRPAGFEGGWQPQQMCTIRGLDVGTLENFRDMDLHVTPTHQWAFNILPLEQVFPDHNVLKLRVPATYPLLNCGTVSDGAWLENAINFMDQPGRWCLNSGLGRLYYWPEEGVPSGEITAPRLQEYVRMEGNIDIRGEDIPVENITLKGLAFVRGDRDVLGENDAAMQHDWDLFDKGNALVRLRGAENCEVIDCRISDTAGVGLRLDLYGQRNRIIGNVIRHTGWSGIVLGGYGPGTKDVNHHNVVQNNHIHHIGLLYRTAIGIHLFQSGDNHIANNLVHHVAQNGITLSCSWFYFWNLPDQREVTRTVRKAEVQAYLDQNVPRFRKSMKRPAGQRQDMEWAKGFEFKHTRNNLIERNEIFNVMERLSEGNCTYIAGVGEHNVFRENFLHSCHVLNGQFAPMRCDDHTWKTTYDGNIVWNVGGYGIEAKHVNDYVDNIFCDVVKGVGRYPGSFIGLLRQNYDNRISGNVFYRITPHGMTDDKFSFYKERHGKWPGLLENQREVDRNCYFIQSNPTRAQAQLLEQQKKNMDQHSICADPMFEDPANFNFKLKRGSPLTQLGIKPVELELIGLQGKYAKHVENTVRTKILPAGGHLKKGERIVLRSNRKNAVIHFTIDGSEPTQDSRRYTGPFEIGDDCIVRAKSFMEGLNDFYGAIRPFTVEKPKDFVEDFENDQVGMPPLRFEVSGSVETVVRSPSGGGKCIALTDNASQPHGWDPHIFLRGLEVKTPRVLLSFDLKVSASVNMSAGFRKWDDRVIDGPMLDIKDGTVFPSGGSAFELPVDEWVRIEMRVHLHESTYDVRAKSGIKELSRQEGLPFNRAVDEISWIGWLSPTKTSSVFYLDNIRFETTAARLKW